MNADQQAPAVLLEKQFQEFLREFRAKHGLTQQMPADALEISRNTLKAWEPYRRGQDETGDAAPARRAERRPGLRTGCRFRPAPLSPASVRTVAPVRSSLINKGMIYSPAHGDTDSTVPLFDQYLRRMMAK